LGPLFESSRYKGRKPLVVQNRITLIPRFCDRCHIGLCQSRLTCPST
jgi:hypothetical protein